MNPRMMVRQLTLEGTASTTYSFRDGVNVIVGAVGTGKSSMLELIKYAMGGSGILSGAVRDGVSSVAVLIELNGVGHVFRRLIDAREIELRSASTGQVVEKCHVTGTKSERSVSDVLLELLGLPRLSVPRSAARPTAETTSITFFDMLAYMYARQTEIDRSVVYHLDPIREPKRKATFEVLYGLADESIAVLQLRVGQLNTDIADGKRRNREIEAFLARANEPTEFELRLKVEALTLALTRVSQHLTDIREGARQATPFADDDRKTLMLAEAALAAAEHEAALATAELERFRRVIAQLELGIERIERSLVAGGMLSPIEFVKCPRCLQSLRGREDDRGHCIVCGLPEPTGMGSDDLQAERERTEAQLLETVALMAITTSGLGQAHAEAARLEAEVRSVRVRVDTRTVEFVSPLADEIEGASRELATLEGQRQAALRSLGLWAQHKAGLDRVAGLETDLRQTAEDLKRSRMRLEAGRVRVVTLSDLFDDLLREFRYPWYESARIDVDTYLPVVNGESFEAASGGMKTLINVAYHVAGLRYGIQQGDSLLPLFLMIDSPRKNLGSENVDDKEIGSQIYSRFRTMQDANPLGFQLIIADNDIPIGVEDFNAIHLDYEHPLVPGIRHPGPGRVEPIE
jgi:hypothetical protein